MKTFNCKLCGITFNKETRSYAYYCDDCRKIKNREIALKYAYKTDRIKAPGVGSGGNQYGENNHQWSNYKAEYSYRHLVELKECELCGATTNLCRHHKDKVRSNNTKENIIVVCRHCHSKLHNLKNNLPNQNLVNSGKVQNG